jgi:hypothetical protein
MVVAMAPNHPMMAKQSVALSDFGDYQYVDRLRCEFREEFFRILNDRFVPLSIAARSEREDWIQSLVLARNGITVLPQHSILLSQLEIRTLESRLSRSVELVRVEGRSVSPAVECLRAFLIQDYSSD